MDKSYRYEYDSECEVLIRMSSHGYPEIFRKGETKWRDFDKDDESYSRAIYLGQGCWESLHYISAEEAEKVWKEWTQ